MAKKKPAETIRELQIGRIADWQDALKKLDARVEDMRHLLGFDDGTLMLALNKVQDEYTRLLCGVLFCPVSGDYGDYDNVLEWYRFGNEYGQKFEDVDVGDEVITVHDPASLYAMIEAEGRLIP